MKLFFSVATETGHPLISRALEDLVNHTRFFPSFTDVLEVVEKVNKEHSLRLRYVEDRTNGRSRSMSFVCSAEAQKQMAEKSFKFIGKQIKTRRMSDFHDIMRSRLPDDFKYRSRRFSTLRSIHSQNLVSMKTILPPTTLKCNEN